MILPMFYCTLLTLKVSKRFICFGFLIQDCGYFLVQVCILDHSKVNFSHVKKWAWLNCELNMHRFNLKFGEKQSAICQKR